MSDPRYDRDPAYRQDIMNKLERSINLCTNGLQKEHSRIQGLQARKRKVRGSGIDKFLSSGGLGLAGLLISSVMKDGKRKS